MPAINLIIQNFLSISKTLFARRCVLLSLLLCTLSLHAQSQGLSFSQSSFSLEAETEETDYGYFSIINDTDSAIVITEVVITGPNADDFSFLGGNYGSPPYTLGGTESFDNQMMVSLVFSPMVAGSKTATLNVVTEQNGTYELPIVAISEVAIRPEMEITILNQPSGTTIFDALAVTVGTPDTIQAIIKNLGNTDLNISDLSLEDITEQYTFVSDYTTPLSIGIGDSIIVNIQVEATYPISIPGPGITSITAKLVIEHDDPKQVSPSKSHLVFYEKAPNPVFSPETLAYGNVLIDTDSTLTFDVSNEFINHNISADLTVTGFDFGDYESVFSSSTSFPFTLATGESTTVSLTVSPDVHENLNGQVTLLGNVNKAINFTAFGAIRELTLSMDTLDFGDVHKDVEYGQSVADFGLSPTGGAPVTITGLTFSGPNASSFEYFGGFPFEVSASSVRGISFFPGVRGKGEKYAVATITSNAENSPHTLHLVANAVYPPILNTSTSLISLEAERLKATDTTFIISNSGTENLTIHSVSFGSSSSTSGEVQFVDFPTFPVVLGDGEELPITVRFAPTGLNDLYATVNIVSGPNFKTVSLQADVTYPIAYISNEFDLPLDSLNFGGVSIEETVVDSLKVVNEGDGDLVISSINIVGAAGGDFAIDAELFPIVIPADTVIRIPINMNPAIKGSRSATLTTVSNNVPSEMSVSLTGNGIEPVLSFSSSIYVGRTIQGDSVEYAQEITNFGDDPATIYGFELTGADADLFYVNDLGFPLTLEAGQTTAVLIGFTPDGDGSATATLTMNCNVVNGPLIATLTAAGFTAPDFYVANDTVIVGGVEVGQMQTVKFGVENKGNRDLVLTSAGFDVGSSGAFSGGSNAFGLPMTIAPGEVDSIEFLFSPIVGGLFEGTLSILTNDDFASENSPTNYARVPIVAEGLGPVPVLSQSSFDFDSSFYGFEHILPFVLTNEGQADLNFDFEFPDPDALFHVLYSGYDAPTVEGSFIPLTLAPGDSQVVNVVFRPVDLGLIQDSIRLAFRNARNEVYYEKLPVSGIGVEPPIVTIGALTFVGDDFRREGAVKTLIGNVHVGDLQLGDEVDIDLENATIEGNGNVYVTDVPPNGNMAHGIVNLRTGGFKYHINGEDSTLMLNPEDESRGESFFEIIGLEVKLNDLKINAEGVRAGGGLSLPEVVFGPDAGFNMDNFFISKDSGVYVSGKFAISSPLTVYELFNIESVEFEFDSFKDEFRGAGSITSEAGAFELSINAEIVMKKGGLDGVSLEIETLPGVPLGTTGFALAGGNGSITGLQVPPLAIALGVDIVPVAPGINKIIRLNNVGFEYTFGVSMKAGGTLQLFSMDIAEAGIEGNNTAISAEAFFSLLEIFKGNARISVMPFGDQLKISGNASLAYTIPEMQEGFPDFIRGVVNEFLPITLAEVSVAFNEERITGATVIPPVPIKISATITLIGETPTITFGAEFTILNDEASSRNGARFAMEELPYAMRFENDFLTAKKHHLEGQSIVINSNINPQGRRLDIENTEFPFSLSNSLEAVIIRVEGEDDMPTFSMVLPTGQEVTKENAFEMGYAYTEFDERNQAHIVLTNTIPGDYLVKIAGTGQFELDIAGAEFGPTLTIESVTNDGESNEIDIRWEDEDLDSDATLSFYYDMDEQGADGVLIAGGISEDDESDLLTWDVSEVDNGTYYVYGIIDDGSNAPVITYYDEAIQINKASQIEVPVLEEAVVSNDNVSLSWSASAGASRYLVYLQEGEALTSASQSYNSGSKTTFTFVDLHPGKSYQFAVSAMNAEKERSNLSNIISLDYISTIHNNEPEIMTSNILDHVRLGDVYTQTVEASDADGDNLTYQLVVAPEEMTINNEVISWTPTSSQVGVSQVKVLVTDPTLAKDSLIYTVTVTDEQSSRASFNFSSTKVNGLDKKVTVTLKDGGVNQNPSLREVQDVTISSVSDSDGINLTLQETSSNSGIFTGSFGFTDEVSSDRQIQVGVADSVYVSYLDDYPAEELVGLVLFERATVPNQLPTSISLNNQIIQYASTSGDLVGVLSTEDADDNSFTYTLASGVGSEDNDLFTIDGQSLILNTDVSELETSFLNVRIRTTDTKNGIYEKTFELEISSILSENDSPVLQEVRLYPNPTSRKVYVRIDSEKGAVKLTLLSSDGRIIQTELFEKNWNDSKVSMNISDLPNGVYFMMIEQEDKLITKRLVKE